MESNQGIEETTGLRDGSAFARPKSRDRRRLLVALAGIVSMALVAVACGGATQTQSDQGSSGAVASNATSAPSTGNDTGTNTAPNGNNNGGPGGGRFNIRETPAPELPTTQADVTGLFVRRDGANLFVGTAFGQGQGQGRPQRTPGTPGANGTRRAPNSGTPFVYNGPTVQVVTNSSTKFYKDVTMMNFQPGANNGGNNAPVQQQVQAVNSLDELIGSDTTNGLMTVWGTKNGDQITATVVVYRVRQGPPVTPTPNG